MKLSSIFITIIILFVSIITNGQVKKNGYVQNPGNIIFRDTAYGWATDSLVHDLGILSPTVSSLIKYFKYTGDDTVFITRALIADPHICDYPKDILIKNKIYSFVIGFSLQNYGQFYKRMIINLSNGQTIYYVFKGEIINPEDLQ